MQALNNLADFLAELCEFRRDMTPSSESKGASSDLESETGEKSRRSRSTVDKMPSQTEIDEFFTVAEKAVRDRFTSR